MPLVLVDDKLNPMRSDFEDEVPEAKAEPIAMKQSEKAASKPFLSIKANPQKALQDVAGLAAAGVRGVAKIPSQAWDLSLGVSEALTPKEERLTPEQYNSLRMTPHVENLLAKGEEAIAPKDYFKPQGGIEKFAQNAVEKIPDYLLFGSGLKGAASAAFGGETGRTIAEKLGLKETGQMLGELFGSFGANLLNNGGKVSDLKKHVSKKYNSFERSIPAKLKPPTDSIKSVVGDIESRIKSGDLVHSEADVLQKEVGRIKKLIRAGSFDTKKAYKETQRLNKLIRHPETPSGAKEDLFNLSRGFRDDIVTVGEFAPNLKVQDLLDANGMFYGMNNLSPLRSMLRKYVNPKTIGAALAGKYVFKGLPEAMVGFNPTPYVNKLLFAGPAARVGTELVESVVKSPQIGKYIGGVAGKAAARTAPALALQNSSRQQPQQQPEKEGLILID